LTESGSRLLLLLPQQQSAAALIRKLMTSSTAGELDHWRKLATRMGSIAEDIRSRECRVVIGVLGSAKSRALRRWRQAESALSEASSEAKDSVRHLSALEKPLQPLFGGSPSTAAEVLPDLMSSIKALHNAARSYSSARSMTRLLRKVVHGMTSRCPCTLR